MNYETLIVETHGAVLLVRLNRPQALNALNDQLATELTTALVAADRKSTRLNSSHRR